ncbi:MAG: squalene/phytoene synthase family protein [Rhodospirillaceae bacterium]|nr:squalene/phytoene synthase family protein [Rhodospirillaceae bacterium]
MPDVSDYIAELVRREDRDRFLTAMFMPADKRADVLALYAFNVELAKIREHVSENMIGRIKLQWWRDVIAGIYAEKAAPKGNPVTEALASLITRHQLPREHFDVLLATRERDMADADDPMDGVSALEAYAEGTSSRLLYLVLYVLGVKGADDAAKHVGIGYALTGLLRAVLFHARENRLYLPGVAGVQDVNTAATAKIVAELSQIAAAHLQKARGLKVDRAAVPALLLATIADQNLSLLKRADYNVADERVVRARTGVARLMWNNLIGSF